MTHPNDMTAWDTIACRRDHAPDDHKALLVDVDLSGPHGYRDLPAVPLDLAVRFSMFVWDPAAHPVDGGPYCPAHDAVSETIVSHRIWEPRETCLMLDVLRTYQPQEGERPMVLDLGCQIGWYSLVAAAAGAYVVGVDAEPLNLALLEHSAALAEGTAGAWTEDGWVAVDEFVRPTLIGGRIQAGAVSPGFPGPWRFVKIDLEGAEADALALLADQTVDHLLVEISPVFKPGDHYPDLVDGLIARGYEAYLLPEKNRPPAVFRDAESFLADHRIDTHPALRDVVAGWHQEDVWFRHAEASW